MAILNLIGSSGEVSRGGCNLKIPRGLRLSSTFRSKDLNDVIQTFCPDYRRSFWDWRRLRLTAQARALLDDGTSHTCLRADPGRSVHQVSFEASLIP